MTAVTTNTYHTCAVASGKAYCWGYNAYGELGNGTTTSYAYPVAVYTSGVLSGKTVTAIYAGYFHNCVTASGNAYCWGYNGYGQLGNNSTSSYSYPVAVYTGGVLSGKTITAISAGSYHSCASADGQAYCWGYNAYGELGNNSTTSSITPVAVYSGGVLSGKTVTLISADLGYTCASASDQAFCWGLNTYGNLGNGTKTDSYVPVSVLAPDLPPGSVSSSSYTFINPVFF